jgi:hypothetical protein
MHELSVLIAWVSGHRQGSNLATHDNIAQVLAGFETPNEMGKIKSIALQD